MFSFLRRSSNTPPVPQVDIGTSTSPDHDLEKAIGPLDCPPSILNTDRSPSIASYLQPEAARRGRAPTGSELTRAINQEFAIDTPRKDELNDLGGQSHIVCPSLHSAQICTVTDVSSQTFADDLASDSATHIEDESRTWLPSKRAWKTYFTQEVAGDRYLEAQLLLMTIATGMLDAMTYTTYSVFTTKQTGNALFLALYAFRNPALGDMVEQNIGVSMGVFFAGAIFWGQLGRVSRQRRRVWLISSQLFQALCILAATAVRYWSSRRSNGPAALGVLALLSFAMSGQIATALNVNMPELNTTMITGALIALASDPNLFKWKNSKRTRRMAFFASIEAGSFIGAAVLNYRSPTATILVCACLKFAIVITFFFNRGIVKQMRELEDGRKEKTDGAVTPVSRILWGD